MNKYIPNKQAMEILNYLRTHEWMSTENACFELHILSPAKRIEELRNGGYQIETVWKKTASGKRFGVYVLHEGGEDNAEQIC